VHRYAVWASTDAPYVNGQPGAVFLDPDGRLLNVISLDIADGVLQTVRSIINPGKLRHLGEPADARALLRARPQVEERAPN
jgi:RNA polymerase sigma-70 factor, ECF subfamily